MSEDIRRIQRALGPVFDAVFGRLGPPRDMQIRAIDWIFADQPLLIVAATAAGKTEAVLAPMLARALAVPISRPFGIWICPTRALVNDLAERIRPAAQRVGLSIAIRTGDHKIGARNDPALLITTLESLDVLLSSKGGAASLRSVGMVVVDEVHLLHGTRRGLQLLMLLKRLGGVAGRKILRVGLSATISDPQAVAQWFSGDGDTAYVLKSGGSREIGLSIMGAHEDGMTATVDVLEKGLAKAWHKLLVFTNTRADADALHERLASRFPHLPVLLHYSSLPREHREDVEKRFKSQAVAICVATSTLELGIDIGDIDATYMYGAPSSISSFLQRGGRSNRRSPFTRIVAVARTHGRDGKPSRATWERDILTFCALDSSASNGTIEANHSAHFWSVVVQQAFSLARYHGRIGLTPLVRAVDREAGRFVDEDGLLKILQHLEILGYVRHKPYGNYFVLEDPGWEWLESLQIWSNFDSDGESIDVVHGGDIIDRIAYGNRALLSSGTKIRLRGKLWEVVSIMPRSIKVLPASGGGGIRAMRHGGAWLMSFELAQEVKRVAWSPGIVTNDLEPPMRPWLASWSGRLQGLDPETQIPIVRDGAFRSLTFMGGTGNRLIAGLLVGDIRVAADDIGVSADRRLMLSRLALDTAEVEAAAKRMRGSIPTTVHFGMLPEEFQQEEITSIISAPMVIDGLKQLASMEPVLIADAPPPPTNAS